VVPEEYGQVKFCISKLYPGLVGHECFMTKGHYHAVLEAGEAYLSLAGRGLMMMKTSGGACRWEEFVPGRLVYVPPYWAHRSINTGDEPLISLCMYPGDAGHNYGDIQTEGFSKRVLKRSGEVIIA
jgi:glucose-6-phosphate isomerase